MRWILILIGLVSVSVHGQSLRFEGLAKDPKSGELLYVERHNILLGENSKYQRGTVEYLTPEGRVFAFKELDYSRNELKPEFSFSDRRDSSKLEVVRPDDSAIIIQREEDGQNAPEISYLNDNVDGIGVVDAGFDRLIVSNWDKLSRGNRIKFSFLAISRGQYFDFELERVGGSEQETIFRARPNNFFLRLIVDPIDLTYDNSKRRLIAYKGVTNIPRSADRGVEDSNYVAVIEYRHQS